MIVGISHLPTTGNSLQQHEKAANESQISGQLICQCVSSLSWKKYMKHTNHISLIKCFSNKDETRGNEKKEMHTHLMSGSLWLRMTRSVTSQAFRNTPS